MNLSQYSDEQLVKKVREGSQDMYSEVIKRYEAKLWHYLRKFIANPDELEDVLQVVFIKVYKNLYAFNTNKKFSSWIYRITHNEAINQIKKYKNRKIPLNEVEYKIIDEKIDIETTANNKLLKQKLETELFKLKLKYREPLILFFLEEKTYQEISEILKIPKNTVGTLILKGKKSLKQNL